MKTVAFKGRDPVRSKIEIISNIKEKISTLIYHVCSIHARMNKMLLLEYQNFRIKGILNGILKHSEVQNALDENI
jgi:hypothetical protein